MKYTLKLVVFYIGKVVLSIFDGAIKCHPSIGIQQVVSRRWDYLFFFLNQISEIDVFFTLESLISNLESNSN